MDLWEGSLVSLNFSCHLQEFCCWCNLEHTPWCSQLLWTHALEKQLKHLFTSPQVPSTAQITEICLLGFVLRLFHCVIVQCKKVKCIEFGQVSMSWYQGKNYRRLCWTYPHKWKYSTVMLTEIHFTLVLWRQMITFLSLRK